MDGSALVWTLLIAVSAAVLFGIAPALRMACGNLQEMLKDTGRGITDGRKRDHMRSALVISEIALASMLMIGAGLLLRSFLRVLDVDLGFEPSRAAAIKVDYDDGGNRARRGALLQETLQRVSALPGVEAAGVADMLPLDRNRSWALIAEQTRGYRSCLPAIRPELACGSAADLIRHKDGEMMSIHADQRGTVLRIAPEDWRDR